MLPKRWFVGLFAFALVTCGHATPQTVALYTTPYIVSYSTPQYTSSGTTLTASFSSVTYGDVIVCHVIHTGGTNTVTGAASGFSGAFGGPNNGTSLGVQTYYHAVDFRETSGSYAFTVAPAQAWQLDCNQWANVNPNAPIAKVYSIATGNGTTLTLPAVTVGVPGTIPVEIAASAASSITATDLGFPTAIWLANNTSVSARAFTTASAYHAFGTPLGGFLNFGSSGTHAAELLFMQPSQNPTVATATSPPVTVPVAKMTKIYNYVQTTGACGGGYGGIDNTAAQDTLWGMEVCQSDGHWPGTAKTQCPDNSNCRVFLYFSTPQLDCSGGEAAPAAWLFSNPGTGDANFYHNSSTHSSSTRLTTAGGVCQINSNSGGTLDIYPNVTASGWNGYLISNLFAGSSWLNSDAWDGMFMDNMAKYFGDFGGGFPNEFSTNTAWRQAIATQLNAFAGYTTVINSEGPGAGSYPHNGSAGVTSWTVDDADLCDNLTAGGKAVVQGELFEKLMGNTSGGSDFVWPHNLKIAVNTAANHWADANCANINLMINGMTGQGGTTSWPQRAFGTVLRAFMQPNSYDGAPTTPGIVMGPRFTHDISSINENAVFVEDEFVFTQPVQQLNHWCWGGGACTGNGQSTSDALGNGCYSGNGDTGGINAYAQLCGMIGTDADGGVAAVYVREFGACYRLGVLIGPCSAVYNASTSTTINISSLSLRHTYTHALSPTGNELQVDPVTPGHNLCNAGYCNGAYQTIPASTVEHCTISGSGAGATWDAMNSANTCSKILLP